MQLKFADCTLDTARHRLLRAGKEVHVEPQVFALLVLLAEKRGDLVTREELTEHIWNGRIVSEATISARINAARKAVGDNGRDQKVIRTVVSKGFQLVVPVEPEGGAADVPPETAPQPARASIRYATSPDGTGLAWSASGDGPPVVRGGHWLTHLERDLQSPVWAPYLSRLGRGRRLVRYDVRGTGLSERECGALTLESFVSDLKAVADSAGLDRFDLVGSSQAAPVSIRFATLYPERVRKLVLIGGFVEGPYIRSPQDKAVSSALVEILRSGWGKRNSAFMRSFSAIFIPGATEDQIEDFIGAQLASASAELAIDYRESIASLNALEYAPLVQAPTLVIHATGDALNPVSQGQKTARLIPNAEFLPVESDNHILLPQDPAWDIVMNAIDAFLSDQLSALQTPTSDS